MCVCVVYGQGTSDWAIASNQVKECTIHICIWTLHSFCMRRPKLFICFRFYIFIVCIHSDKNTVKRMQIHVKIAYSIVISSHSLIPKQFILHTNKYFDRCFIFVYISVCFFFLFPSCVRSFACYCFVFVLFVHRQFSFTGFPSMRIMMRWNYDNLLLEIKECCRLDFEIILQFKIIQQLLGWFWPCS